MIKLDEQDIKAIAARRFYQRCKKQIQLVAIFLIIVFFTTAILTNVLHATAVSAVLFLIGYVWLFRGEKKAQNELIEQWKKEGVS